MLEMLFVLVLIGMIAGLVIGNLGGILEGSKEDTVKLFVNQSIELPLMAYKRDLRRYPTTEEMKGFSALLNEPSGSNGKWRGPYLKAKPEDPWGREYQYRSPGIKKPKGYDLWSMGSDGVESEDDIGNWN